jgi:fructose-bisphosphate aldolase class II
MKKLTDVIREAEEKKVAIGHFNIGNLEQLKAVARAARRLDVPVIIGVSEGERAYFGVHHVKDLIASYNAEHAQGNSRLFLNADHTHSLDLIKEATRAGFDEVLFDAGVLPLEKNIALTREAVKAAKALVPGVLVEGELGNIGSGSEIRTELPKGAAVRPEDFTKPEDAARFVKETGVDLLAPAVGNIHGMFAGRANPRLDIERIRAIREAAGVPLVLHGGSGIRDEDFTAAIAAGISIIHISTELRVAWRKGLEDSLDEHTGEVAPYKVLPEVIEVIERVVEQRLRLFSRL